MPPQVFKEKNQASTVSPSTIANAMGIFFFSHLVQQLLEGWPYTFRKGRFCPLALLVYKMGIHQCMV